jgi:hypothetical protein
MNRTLVRPPDGRGCAAFTSLRCRKGDPRAREDRLQPVTEHAPEAEAKRERRVWSTVFWSIHALWIYALVVAGIILLVIYLTGGFGEGGAER